jgi:prophage regulatory protein
MSEVALTQRTYLRAKAVRIRYGNVSDMWIWRRLHDAINPFPQPIKFVESGARFWDAAALDAWDAAHAPSSETEHQ